VPGSRGGGGRCTDPGRAGCPVACRASDAGHGTRSWRPGGRGRWALTGGGATYR